MLFFISTLYACVSPDPFTELSAEKKDLYVTNRDVSVDFSNYQTYVIVDSVRVVSRTSTSVDETVSSAPLILDTVNDELQKAGFIKTDTSQNPDVGISVSVLKFSEEVPTTFFPYVTGGGFVGYVPPAFYGFPGYAYAFPPYYGYYEIQIGSISIEMFDLKTARTSGNNQLNLIWSALLAGSLADSTTSNTNERITRAITSAFSQSPYLRDGK